jgi:hypothetical protein
MFTIEIIFNNMTHENGQNFGREIDRYGIAINKILTGDFFDFFLSMSCI